MVMAVMVTSCGQQLNMLRNLFVVCFVVLLASMMLYWWWKPEHLEEIHVNTGRTCKLYTESPNGPARIRTSDLLNKCEQQNLNFKYSSDLDEPLRIILVGMTGAGRSASGNTILGKKVFKSEISSSSVTKRCETSNAIVHGRNISVVDTPGLIDTSLTKDELMDRIKQCLPLSAPGPHVFLVVIQLGRFTDENEEAVKTIQNIFGQESSTYTMALFTHGDRLKGKNIHRFIRDSPKLLRFIKYCGGRFHVFNNEDPNPEQVMKLFDDVDKIVTGNEGQHYTSLILERERAIEAEKHHIMREKEEDRKKETEALKARLEDEAFLKAKEKLDNMYEQQARWQAVQKIDVQNGWSFLDNVKTFFKRILKLKEYVKDFISVISVVANSETLRKNNNN